jgi:hypothetical protein
MADLSLGSIAIVFVGTLIYAGLFGLKSLQAGNPADWVKFIATLAMGVVVGAISIITGIVPTQMDVEAQLVAFAGLTAVIEAFLKLIKRAIWPNPIVTVAVRR